jgi:hypothetical protein
MSSFMLQRSLDETRRSLANATDQVEIDRLNQAIEQLKQAIWEVQMIEFEERVGFKSMEQNAGVWDER